MLDVLAAATFRAVGLRQALRLVQAIDDTANASGVVIGGPGDVAQVRDLPASVAQAFGINPTSETVTRREAMSIPAVRRGRQVIAGTVGTLALSALRTNPNGSVEQVDRQLLSQPDPNTTRQHVLTWTVDDLMFYGISWWRVTARDAQGYPTQAFRVAPWRLRIDYAEGRVYVDNQPVSDNDLIRFDGPDDGVLCDGATSLRTCLRIEMAVRNALGVPLDVLKLAEGAAELSTAPGSGNPDDENDLRSEVDILLDSWEAARLAHSTAFVNRAIDHNVVQFDATRAQLAELRQSQNAEVARLLNLPPSYVNAPQASGMTYTNREVERSELADTIAPFTTAIEQRLSMGDVTPRGQVAAFDLVKLTRGTLLDVVTAAEKAVPLGILDGREIRTEYLGRPPLAHPAPATPEVPTP